MEKEKEEKKEEEICEVPYDLYCKMGGQIRTIHGLTDIVCQLDMSHDFEVLQEDTRAAIFNDLNEHATVLSELFETRFIDGERTEKEKNNGSENGEGK